jgi:phosphoesterase RecJ-like protein
MLGKIFLNNSDLFYRTTIVNLDYHNANERYGQINYIDPNTTSISEIVYQLGKLWYEKYLDQNNATSLLTGMIATTHSFKTTNVDPSTLQVASELINHGADREKIIHHLYRTRSLSTLKLWGTALMRLKIDTQKRFAWTTLTIPDFLNAGANYGQLKDLITELIENSPEVDSTLLLYEEEVDSKKQINGILNCKKNDTLQILKPHNPSGIHRRAYFCLKNINMAEAEKIITEEIKKSL